MSWRDQLWETCQLYIFFYVVQHAFYFITVYSYYETIILYNIIAIIMITLRIKLHIKLVFVFFPHNSAK